MCQALSVAGTRPTSHMSRITSMTQSVRGMREVKNVVFTIDFMVVVVLFVVVFVVVVDLVTLNVDLYVAYCFGLFSANCIRFSLLLTSPWANPCPVPA